MSMTTVVMVTMATMAVMDGRCHWSSDRSVILTFFNSLHFVPSFMPFSNNIPNIYHIIQQKFSYIEKIHKIFVIFALKIELHTDFDEPLLLIKVNINVSEQ